MNVAVLGALDSVELAVTGRSPGIDLAGQASDWIDPEGDDWLTEIYREVALDVEPSASPRQSPPDLDYWFG